MENASILCYNIKLKIYVLRYPPLKGNKNV